MPILGGSDYEFFSFLPNITRQTLATLKSSHADLLFELVSRRYEAKSTLVTTNRPVPEWSEVFPNAACVVSLVDRLVHNAEVTSIKILKPLQLPSGRERGMRFSTFASHHRHVPHHAQQ